MKTGHLEVCFSHLKFLPQACLPNIQSAFKLYFIVFITVLRNGFKMENLKSSYLIGSWQFFDIPTRSMVEPTVLPFLN